MCTRAAGTSRIVRSPWLYCLHCFYAGLFAFVLPLLCWNVQAAPAYPQGTARFVFAEPLLQAQVMGEDSAGSAALGRPARCATRPAARAVDQIIDLAEVSVSHTGPSQLAVTLLLSRDLVASLLPFNADRREIWQWFALPMTTSLALRIATPPPRAAAFATS